MAELESSEDQGSKRPGVFKDLSMAQVIAGALASVTSMLLTEQIGIAGGIIGVVVSSVAYTVTAKVYGNMLASSGEKLRDHLGSDVTERISPATPAAEAYRTELIGRASADGTRLMPRPVEAEGRTGRHGAHAADPRAEATRRVALDSATPQDLTAEGGRIAPPELRAQAAGKRQAETRKKVIIVSVVAALAAMAVSALVVMALTAGNGLGAKPSEVSTASVSVTDEAATKEAATTHAAKTTATTAKTAEAETSAAASEPATQQSSSSSKETGGNSGSESGSVSAGNATTSGSHSSEESSDSSSSDGATAKTQQSATGTAKTEATSSSAAATAEASAQ